MSEAPKARLVDSYVHLGRIGVLVELETDDELALRTDELRRLARDLAVHIAAMAPVGIEPVAFRSSAFPGLSLDVDPQAIQPVLLTQTFVRDERMTVAQRIRLTEEALSAAIRVRRFVRFAVDDD